MTMMEASDRRRHRRIRMRTPIRGAVGESRVFLTDSSVRGIGVAHEEGTLPAPGSICRLELKSDWGPIRLDCEVVRTVERVVTQTRRPVYQSGLEIIVMDPQSAERLKTMIESVSNDDF
jgi:hypothetical protein